MSRRFRPALRAFTRSTAYPLFYRLPHRVRIRLVRLIAPTFTVGSVVLVRDAEADGAGRLLLLRQPPGRSWSLPAGLLGRGETPVEGALRELAEESGIMLRPDQLCRAVPNAVVHHRGRWVDMVFEASVPASTTPLTVDSVEVLEAAWHPLDKLPQLTRPTARLLGCYGIGPWAGDGATPIPDGQSTAGGTTGAGWQR